MGMDFNLAESEWAKEDDKELNKLLTKEEIKIEILEKQIGILKQENEQLRKNLAENESDCEMCNFPKLKTELEEENAELKEELKDANEKVVHLACNQNKDLKRKINKAKDLLKDIVDTPMYNQIGGEMYENKEYKELIAEVEQFLKELIQLADKYRKLKARCSQYCSV